jgi:hypothetical protein
MAPYSSDSTAWIMRNRARCSRWYCTRVLIHHATAPSSAAAPIVHPAPNSALVTSTRGCVASTSA